MKRSLIIGLILLMCIPLFAKKKETIDISAWRYEVQGLGVTAKDGKSVIFKIWSYGKKENNALMQAGKNAVHAVIFKQIEYNPAIIESATLSPDQKNFFELFFSDGGEYIRFVTLANNGAVAPTDKIKLNKEYKIGVRVTVNRADLRAYLEDCGIIQKMRSVF